MSVVVMRLGSGIQTAITASVGSPSTSLGTGNGKAAFEKANANNIEFPISYCAIYPMSGQYQ
jgi:hypothetical protein